MPAATHAYVLLLMLAAAVSAACAGGFLFEAPERRPNRLAGFLLGGAAFWALCEVAWNLAPDPETALFWMRLSSPGWMFIGPVVLHCVLAASPRRRPILERMLAPLYIVTGVLLAIGWTTDWIIVDAVRTSWGNAYRVGPLYPFFYLITMAGVIPSVYVISVNYRGSVSQAERRERPFAMVGMLTPFVVASVTDVLLPMLDIQVPRLGSTSFAVLGAVAVANLLWYGHSFLSPGTFADEILATLSDGVALLYRTNRVRSANPALAAISGYSPDELPGVNLRDLLPDAFNGQRAAAAVGFETHLVRRDHERIPVSVAASELRDRHGLSLGLVVVVRDLREVSELRRRLVTSARLAAVGELAAGIAHEINNPIAYVRANLTQLQEHWKIVRGELAEASRNSALAHSLDEADELLIESLEGVDRAAEIVRGVKSFSHSGPGTSKTIDMNSLLEDVLRMASAQLRGRVTIERRFGNLPAVACAPQELKQVFLNLVLNAGQAVKTDGRIVIETRARGDSILVRVEDDGLGIPADIIDRIFDPFFTTKKVGEGTGLGLGIAYQIIRAHGGDISVKSVRGRGTIFSVQLPLAPSGAYS